MSDQRLRELERKWRESGTVEDEAAYLREQVRVGDITREGLEIGASFGDEIARFTLADQAPSLLPAGSLEELLEMIKSCSKQVVIRAALAAVRAAGCSSIEDWDADYVDFHHQLIEAACDWLRCPCDDHMDQAWTISHSDTKLRESPRYDWSNDRDYREYCNQQYSRWRSADRVAYAAKRAVKACACREHRSHAIGITAQFASPIAIDAIKQVALEMEEQVVWQAIRDALIPWALGRGDPVLGLRIAA